MFQFQKSSLDISVLYQIVQPHQSLLTVPMSMTTPLKMPTPSFFSVWWTANFSKRMLKRFQSGRKRYYEKSVVCVVPRSHTTDRPAQQNRHLLERGWQDPAECQTGRSWVANTMDKKIPRNHKGCVGFLFVFIDYITSPSQK